MGVHKLEIEIPDELMSKIERISATTQSSPSEVVVGAIANLRDADDGGSTLIDGRRAFLHEIFERASKLGAGRSQEDIDRQVREFRADRDYT